MASFPAAYQPFQDDQGLLVVEIQVACPLHAFVSSSSCADTSDEMDDSVELILVPLEMAEPPPYSVRGRRRERRFEMLFVHSYEPYTAYDKTEAVEHSFDLDEVAFVVRLLVFLVAVEPDEPGEPVEPVEPDEPDEPVAPDGVAVASLPLRLLLETAYSVDRMEIRTEFFPEPTLDNRPESSCRDTFARDVVAGIVHSSDGMLQQRTALLAASFPGVEAFRDGVASLDTAFLATSLLDIVLEKGMEELHRLLQPPLVVASFSCVPREPAEPFLLPLTFRFLPIFPFSRHAHLSY